MNADDKGTSRNDFPPSVSVRHPIHGGMMNFVDQQFFDGLLDSTQSYPLSPQKRRGM